MHGCVCMCVSVCVCQEHNFSTGSCMATFAFAKLPQWFVLPASLVGSFSYCEATFWVTFWIVFDYKSLLLSRSTLLPSC